MERNFWLERWNNQQIGFHQPEGQPLLAVFWPTLTVPAKAAVLVPLCGKTPDMAWLAARDHWVTGVEFSERAAQDFFAEHGRTPLRENDGPFIRYSDDAINVCVGDFFDLTPQAIGAFDAVYDRAALIALPRQHRAAYAAHLLAGLASGAAILLITLDYDPGEMAGPPFAVPDAEVFDLYGEACEIALLYERSGLSPDDPLRARGLTQAVERVYCLIRR